MLLYKLRDITLNKSIILLNRHTRRLNHVRAWNLARAITRNGDHSCVRDGGVSKEKRLQLSGSNLMALVMLDGDEYYISR
jgi:hypothetical protein